MTRVLTKLAAPGALALTLVAIGGAAIVGAQSFADELRSERRQVATQRTAAEQRMARVQHEATEIDLRVAQYLSLAKRGILGEENRLDWIEGLSRAKAAAGLRDVQYAFAAQKPLTTTGDVVTQSSLVKVEAKVLHEERFLAFLRALDREMSPLVSVESCSMSRGTSRLAGEGLVTQCQIALITLSDQQKGRP